MGLLNQFMQILFGAHVGIQTRPIQAVITMIGVMREVTFSTAPDPAVNLLQWRSYPQRIDPKLLQIIKFFG
ncbi:Uncharacterised protein [Yersinia enterocolitica]|nr:Uncharacterised protein [Yersinia enterocolitica]